MAQRFAGFDWKTEEDAFNDGFRQAGRPGAPPIDSQGGDTGYLATYELLQAAGNNGVQLPIKEVKDGKLVGTTMLYTDEVRHQGRRAEFKPSPWPGLPETGDGTEGEAQVLDQQRARQRGLADRVSRPVQRLRARSLPDGLSSRSIRRTPVNRSAPSGGRHRRGVQRLRLDLRDGVPGTDAKRGQTFMLFGQVKGIAGDVTTEWTDRNIIPYYKGTWASIRRVGTMEDYKRTVSFKSRQFG